MCNLAAIDANGKKVKAADIKARHMQNIINAAKAFNKIDMVILFGSAMTSGCTAKSDTDIAILLLEINISGAFVQAGALF